MIKSLIITLLAGYLLICAYAYLRAERRIFRPPVSSYSSSSLPIRTITTEDGIDIALVHLDHPNAEFTILYHHGNAEDLGMIFPVLQQIRNAGFNVIAFDYRGYGLSGGRVPTVAGSILDAEAAYRYATETVGTDPSRLLLLGRSVGSGPATDLATRLDVGGLIIEGGFVSAFRVVTGVSILPFDHFQNERLIRTVDVPVLIIHGNRDAVIPVRHGRRLFAAAREPKRMLEIRNGGHSDLMVVAPDEYLDALRSFSESISASAGR